MTCSPARSGSYAHRTSPSRGTRAAERTSRVRSQQRPETCWPPQVPPVKVLPLTLSIDTFNLPQIEPHRRPRRAHRPHRAPHVEGAPMTDQHEHRTATTAEDQAFVDGARRVRRVMRYPFAVGFVV